MSSIEEKIANANRLKAIAERVGFALWQLQELEGATAQYLVLITKAERSMGIEAGTELTNKAQSKTFGKTVGALVESKLLSKDLEEKFQFVLIERNWLVHNSRASSGKAVYNEVIYAELVLRIDMLAEQALSLLKEISSLSVINVKKHGVSQADIDAFLTRALDD